MSDEKWDDYSDVVPWNRASLEWLDLAHKCIIEAVTSRHTGDCQEVLGIAYHIITYAMDMLRAE